MNRINNSILFIFIIYTYSLSYIQWLYLSQNNKTHNFPISFGDIVYCGLCTYRSNETHGLVGSLAKFTRSSFYYNNNEGSYPVNIYFIGI